MELSQYGLANNHCKSNGTVRVEAVIPLKMLKNEDFEGRWSHRFSLLSSVPDILAFVSSRLHYFEHIQICLCAFVSSRLISTLSTRFQNVHNS